MTDKVQQRLIEEEMKEAYIDYAMSVIVSRALPNVCDGLKPVHRRILYAMKDMGMFHNKPFKKCARIVGEVLGKYHPHGDVAVYDSLVRMAQEFSLRYPLINGHGNFGSIDGDRAAAMRYTEARLQRLASEMLEDIDKDTVDFVDNFDASLKEPTVLPSKLPNLLINGSTGIAVGMATNIPPHNLSEVLDACIAFVDNQEVSVQELMKYVKGPDFPTGGIILGKQGIMQAHTKGKGSVKVRSKVDIEDNKLIITEIPYQVNKTTLIEGIVNLVKTKRVEGISDIRDESDRDGMRVVIILKKGVNAELILNQLYKNSQLQTSFGMNMIALVNNQPKTLNLLEMIKYFVLHRKDIVIKRTKFDLKKAEKRAHILEGLKIALENIDEVVRIIKSSKDVENARRLLIAKFSLSLEQSQAILDMRLHRLTSLETKKLNDELKELVKLIKELREILGDERKVYSIIKEEFKELKKKYGDERRTELLDVEEEIEDEDLIKKENVVVTVTHDGYVNRLPVKTYRQQGRGGTGIKATGTKEEDFVENIFTTSTHDYLLFFSNLGRVYWNKAYAIPSSSRYAKGMNLINLLRLREGERIRTIIPVSSFEEGYLNIITKKGLIKKTALKEYGRPRKGGIVAVNLKQGDNLVEVILTKDGEELVVATASGRAIRFKDSLIRPVGRNSMGVRAIKLRKDKVIGVDIARDSLLTITENGFGKRTNIKEYSTIGRGGLGVINIKTSERNGKVIGVKSVKSEDDLMLVTKKGTLIRVSAKNISKIGRNTQGVRIMKLKDGDKVISVARVF
ncbi:DNA gyrase subunit A [Candidatus Woesearchaeota archaeon]|jgi:DNA gyrase subunit A|nr:DNA gyrase subunit A [Candidatus Woesearchaeota archaeon]MBT4322292.1 DNA gyrase subunit A [Candidatus Woesearchaeota archaeon]MBT4630865.1 DNA gyrase subunit A [Candidatus Woesearchaeota archaeon]